MPTRVSTCLSQWGAKLVGHYHKDLLVFTEAGILLDRLTGTCLLSIDVFLERLKQNVLSFQLFDGQYVAVKCQLLVSESDLLKLGFQVHPVKSFLSTISHDLQYTVMKALHWLEWDLRSIYCAHCGRELDRVFDSVEKTCSGCGAIFFPTYSPAVIVVVCKAKEILFARSSHFEPGIYGAIAGFVESGETAEAAVHREVEEEVGIKIQQLEYVCSQSWPFPDRFMLAFKACYLSGSIQINRQEIEEAGWFDVDHLPKLSCRASVAWRLIHTVKQELKGGL